MLRAIRPAIALFLLAILCITTVGSAASQEATADATPGGPSEGYPVSIHEGTCDNPTAEVAWEIGDAVSVGVNEDEPDVIGSSVTRPVAEVSKDLDFKLDSVAESDHVIAVHASRDDMGTLVACGEIAGIRVDGKLVVALAPVGDSQVSGIAILDEDTGGILGLGGDKTRVTAYLVVPNEEDAATPDA